MQQRNTLTEVLEIHVGNAVVSVIDANGQSKAAGVLSHFHPMCEFHYVTSGTVSLKTGLGSCEVSAGQFAVVPSNYFHWTHTEEQRYRRYVFLFCVKGTSDRSSPEYEYYNRIFGSIGNIVICQDPVISECVESIIALQESGLQDGRADRAEASGENSLADHRKHIYFSMLFMKLAEAIAAAAWPDGMCGTDAEKQNDRHLSVRYEIGEYILAHYKEKNVLAELARHLNMSTRNTSRLVRKVFGVSLGEMIINLRMNNARDYICETDMTFQEIAEETGYNDYSTFYKTFRKYFGCGPEKFRKAAVVQHVGESAGV